MFDLTEREILGPQLDGAFLQLYPEGEKTHGREHALEAAQLCLEIAQEPEYQKANLTEEDLIMLKASALFHDFGYSESAIYWAGTQWEHPYESAKQAGEVLAETPFFVERPDKLAVVKFLILNHDNTNYFFPAYKRFEGLTREGFIEVYGSPNLPPGMVFATPDIEDYILEALGGKIIPMLQILIEADSRLGSAQRTIEYSKSRGVPLTANDGEIPGIGMPMWQYSGVANVILAAKRALLDAYTKKGQDFAWQMFLESREFVKEIVNEEQKRHSGFVPPDFDNVGELLRREDVENFIWESAFGVRFRDWARISQAFPLESLKYIIESDKKVVSRLIRVSDISGSIKVEDSRLRLLNNLRMLLIKNYAFDILTEISGALRVITEMDFRQTVPTAEHILIPPIVDKNRCLLRENSFPWVALAKELGLSKIRVLVTD